MDKKTTILEEYDRNKNIYERFANKVRQLLEDLIGCEKISYNAITCRVKDRDSLAKKVDIKNDKYSCLRDITDIAGIRIITYYSDDVDKVADIVEREFEVDRVNSIDKRKAIEPDRFGYCSVHYIVGLSAARLRLNEYKMYKNLKCEIQIRTILQHAWAEIEHDLGYKSEIALPKEIRRNFSRLSGLLEVGDEEFLRIREYLRKYTVNVTKKINEKELDETELDAITLSEFIKTDEDIQRLNNTIATEHNAIISKNSSNYHFENTLSRLQWLGIHTLVQLKELLTEEGENAVKIARIVLEARDKEESEIKLHFTSSVGVFYLCYAKLLKSYRDRQSIHKYFTDTKIKTSDHFIDKLLKIQKELKL